MNGDGKYTVNDFLDMKNEDILKENGGKKFDIVLMNPPYGNLHMKFLKKVSEISNKVISIQPINKFQDAIQNNKKLPVKITNIDVIDQYDANDTFGIGIWVDCGIIYIDNINKTEEIDNFKHIIKNYDLYKKIKEKSKDNIFNHIKQKITSDYPLRYFVGCHWDRSHLYEGTPISYEKSIKTDKNGHIGFISLNSEDERKNLFKYGFTDFFKFCVKIGGPKLVPWLDDYTKEWTDEMLYKYFDITKDEQKEIENEIKDFRRNI